MASEQYCELEVALVMSQIDANKRIAELETDLAEEVKNRDQAEAAADLLASMVLGEPIGWTFHDDAWQRAVLKLRDALKEADDGE